MPRKTKQKPTPRWEQSQDRKRLRRKPILVLIGLGLTGAAVYWTSRLSERNEQAAVSTRQVPVTRQAEQIPPFFESEEVAKPMPATLSPASFSNPSVGRAYRVAREIPKVLAQQPCYCYCDKFGHRGLLDCYRDNHGAG
jgi:hypothetical protein